MSVKQGGGEVVGSKHLNLKQTWKKERKKEISGEGTSLT